MARKGRPIIRAFCARAIEGEGVPSEYNGKIQSLHEFCRYSNCDCPCNHPWQPIGSAGSARSESKKITDDFVVIHANGGKPQDRKARTR